MSITVITSGAIEDKQIFKVPEIGTLESLIDAIKDDIDDVQNQYTTQISQAILAAIRFCARERFYFNEKISTFLTTQPRQSCYPLEKASAIEEVWLKEHKLEKLNAPDLSRQEQGTPTSYALFDNALYLFPIPDQSYSLKLLISPAYLDAIVDLDQKSAWFTEGFDLIKARAKYELYKNTLQDEAMAALSYKDYREQLALLQVETSRRISTNTIKPSSF